jgi:hypothetical protein
MFAPWTALPTLPIRRRRWWRILVIAIVLLVVLAATLLSLPVAMGLVHAFAILAALAAGTLPLPVAIRAIAIGWGRGRVVTVALSLSLTLLTAGTTGTRRTQFILRDLAVAILVQLLQGFRSLGDFIGVDDAVAIEVQRLDQRRWRTMPALLSARAAALLATLLVAIAARGRWRRITLLIACRGLRQRGTGRERQGEREEMSVSFHVFFLGVAYREARGPKGCAMQ